jgi:hypothetical protein
MMRLRSPAWPSPCQPAHACCHGGCKRQPCLQPDPPPVRHTHTDRSRAPLSPSWLSADPAGPTTTSTARSSMIARTASLPRAPRWRRRCARSWAGTAPRRRWSASGLPSERSPRASRRSTLTAMAAPTMAASRRSRTVRVRLACSFRGWPQPTSRRRALHASFPLFSLGSCLSCGRISSVFVCVAPRGVRADLGLPPDASPACATTVSVAHMCHIAHWSICLDVHTV